ncbi:hypothetical protein MMA231_02760 [Asticcacaulis sp. MM231]|uniref:hypothetical protein n=1 Tax=Asticcacaulis sp. MM231 TaxID=3157666 RepID=UPI0032D5A332
MKFYFGVMAALCSLTIGSAVWASEAGKGMPLTAPGVPHTLIDLNADQPDVDDVTARKNIKEALQKAQIQAKVVAAQGGDLDAQVWLGEHYSLNSSFRDGVEGLRWLMVAAQRGDAASQARLAQVYDGNHGVVRNRVQALQWYDKAAASGNADARAELCLTYVHGKDRPRDIARAKGLCQLAGNDARGHAYYAMGLMHEQGLGLPVDLATARAYYDVASERGLADATDRLGVLAETPDEATALFRKAMTGGSLAGAEHMAHAYEVSGDLVAAARLYRYAATRGSASASDWLSTHPAELLALPPMLNLSDAGRDFAIVRIPAHDDLPTIETNFRDYFSQASDYYPERAVEEEIEGESDIVCHISPQRKVTDCLPVAETPVGYGFNAAILRFLDQEIEVRQGTDQSGLPLVGRDFEIIFKWQME